VIHSAGQKLAYVYFEGADRHALRGSRNDECELLATGADKAVVSVNNTLSLWLLVANRRRVS
jgi:hypothetical protein